MHEMDYQDTFIFKKEESKLLKLFQAYF